MDAVALFASDRQIALLVDQLQAELDEQQQNRLRNQLVEEENRFGSRTERLQMTERRMAEGETRILKQRNLIEELKHKGADVGSAQRILDLMVGIQTQFEAFKRNILAAMSRSEL